MDLEIRQYDVHELMYMLDNGTLRRVGKPNGNITYSNIHTASDVLRSIFGREIALPALNMGIVDGKFTLYDDENKIEDLYVFINNCSKELSQTELNKLLDTRFAASITNYDIGD